MFEAALHEALSRDKQKERGEELVGAFWGLPSSFKGTSKPDLWNCSDQINRLKADTYNVVGVDTSLGCSPYVGIGVSM